MSGGFLLELEVIIAPLNEQKRITDKLDSILARVDACRERLDRIPVILKRFRQAVLSAATSGKLTEEWRANKLTQQSHESNQMKTGRAVLNTVQVKKNEWVETNLNHNEVERVRRRLSKFSAELITPNNLPENWCWAKLEDVSLFVVDCHNKTAPYEKTGIALVRTSNIRDGNFIWDDLRYSTLDIQPPTLRHPNDGTAGKLMPFAADSAATSVILGRRAVWGR